MQVSAGAFRQPVPPVERAQGPVPSDASASVVPSPAPDSPHLPFDVSEIEWRGKKSAPCCVYTPHGPAFYSKDDACFALGLGMLDAAIDWAVAEIAGRFDA